MPGSVWSRSDERRSLMSGGMSERLPPFGPLLAVAAASEEDVVEDAFDEVGDGDEDEDDDELPLELVDAELFSTLNDALKLKTI